MLHLDPAVRLGEVSNSQPTSHHALASLAGTWKAEERGVTAHSHQVPVWTIRTLGQLVSLGLCVI